MVSKIRINIFFIRNANVYFLVFSYTLYGKHEWVRIFFLVLGFDTLTDSTAVAEFMELWYDMLVIAEGY